MKREQIEMPEKLKSGQNEIFPVDVQFSPPPSQVTELHKRLKESVRVSLGAEGLTLLETEEAPALVTVVNSSRYLADIKRDLALVQGRFLTYVLLLT